MASKREQVLSALFGRLQEVPLASVKRNEALPQIVPAGGLVILRDGDPGEPDVTLNPVHLFFSHRAEIEAFVTPLVGGGGEALLDTLIEAVTTALAIDRSLGGLVENLTLGAPVIEALVIEGAAPILVARVPIVIEYLVSDPLAAALADSHRPSIVFAHPFGEVA
jgi:hypothetical protein